MRKPRFGTRPTRTLIVSLTIMVIVMIGWAILITLALRLFENDESKSDWNIERIQEHLGVNIPSDAQDIEIEGKLGYGTYLNLTFSAPSGQTTRFANQFCGGILHQSYDPFNAIDVGFDYSYTHEIEMNRFQYSSYSPNTPDTWFGNRCWSQETGIHQILVDKTDPTLYRIRFQLTTACNLLSPPLPCWFVDPHAIRPLANFPLMVFGMNEESGRFVLTSPEICIDTYINLDDRWYYLIGSEIRFSIDDHLKPTAYFDERMRIVPTSNDDGDDSPPKSMFTYCLMETWVRGLHTMTINVISDSGEEYEYSWEFWVE